MNTPDCDIVLSDPCVGPFYFDLPTTKELNMINQKTDMRIFKYSTLVR